MEEKNPKNLELDMTGLQEPIEISKPNKKSSIEGAKAMKEKGNNSFKYKDHKMAINWYEWSLNMITDYETAFNDMLKTDKTMLQEDIGEFWLIIEIENKHNQIKELKAVLNHNLSTCHHGKLEYHEALYYNQRALGK